MTGQLNMQISHVNYGINGWTETGIKSQYPRRYFCYGLLLEDGSIYYGMTGQLIERLTQHLMGSGAKPTIKSTPKYLVFLKECSTKIYAESLEKILHSKQRCSKLMFSVPERYENLFHNIQRAAVAYDLVNAREFL